MKILGRKSPLLRKREIVVTILIPRLVAESTPKAETTKSEDREFDYSPEKPVNGNLRGVVELGATGFNSFVINHG